MPKWIDETFLRLDFDNLWERFDDSEHLIACLAERDIAIILSCLRYTLWSSRWFDSDNRLLRDVGRDTDLETALTYAEQLQGRLLMACSLSSDLQAIATAITNKNVCCNGVGPGYISDGQGGVWYGSEEPIAKPTTFGGVGEFETETAFNEHLCAAANNMVAGLILSLNNWSAMSLVSVIAGSVLVAFLVATPPVAIFVALGVLAGGFALLQTLANYIDTNRQDWVCAIYNATGYSDMLVQVDTLIGEAVVALDIGLFEVNITDIIHAALSTDVFNQAYSVIGLPAPIDPVDCTVCVEEEAWEILSGTGELATDGTSFVISSALVGANHYIEVSKKAAYCDNNDLIELVSTTNSPQGGMAVWQWNAGGCPGQTRLVTSATPILGSWQARSMSLTKTNGAFTITVKITET